MPVQMKIEVVDERVRDLFKRLQRKMDDLTPVLREVGEIVREGVMQNFREGRSPDGVPWKPSRRALLQGGKTLIDTATLRNSIHVRALKNRVRVGTQVEYAAVHQFGAKRGSFGEYAVRVRAHKRRSRRGVEHMVRGHVRRMKLPWGDIPPRPFLGVRREGWGEIQDALMEYLMGA